MTRASATLANLVVEPHTAPPTLGHWCFKRGAYTVGARWPLRHGRMREFDGIPEFTFPQGARADGNPPAPVFDDVSRHGDSTQP